jgi:ADP-ribosyl-[dinitrogen reductase] hydrolase
VISLDKIVEGLRKGDGIGGPTMLAGIVADSLKARCCLDVEDLSSRYLAWWREGSFDTGPIFSLVFSRVDGGMRLAAAVREVDELVGGQTAGCGPAHRSAPLAACPFIPSYQLPDLAREEARITHWHPHAGDAAAIVVMLCRHLLEGQSWTKAKELVGQRSETKNAYEAVMSRPLTDTGYSLDAVRAALHFMDGDDALAQARKFAGGANYCPVIVGALIGSFGR